MKHIEKYKIHMDGTISNTKTGKVLKPQDNGKGYKKVTLTIDGKQIQRYIHRLVAEAYCKKPKSNESLQVNHINGIKSDNIYLNLEWVTNSENQKHAHKTGLKKNGNELWNGKFSKEEIESIFAMKKQGWLQYKIAEHYNVSKGTISEILSGKRYQNLYFALTDEELTIKQ